MYPSPLDRMDSPGFFRRRALRAASLVLASATLLAPCANAVAQAGYPSRTVRLIVGFAAGTGPDIVARVLAQKLSENWSGTAVIVDNKPGAGGLIAASEAARATPDGYTLMLGETGQLSIAPSSYNRLPYDPAKDFVPVSQVVSSDFVLLVNPQKTPARNVPDFVEWARRQNRLVMGTFGAGTPGHFGAHLFADAAKLVSEPVHYRTTSDALGGVFAGDVHAVFASVGLAAPNVKAGKLAALGTTGGSRTSLPGVPTMKEQGYPSLEFTSWFGIVAPAKTPADILAKLSQDVVKAVQSPDSRARLEEAGFRVTGSSRDTFARIIAEDKETWGKAVAATGFKAD